MLINQNNSNAIYFSKMTYSNPISLLLLLSLDFCILTLAKIGFQEPFDLRTIVLDALLYLAVIVLTGNNRTLKALMIKAFFWLHIGLLVLIISNIILDGNLILFSDDFMYNREAKKAAMNLPFFRNEMYKWARLYQGAYYLRFLETMYRLFGANTLVGRYLNIFFLILIGILIYKAFSDETSTLYKTITLIVFFPDFVVFSLFEFKDILFSVLCVLIIFAFREAVKHKLKPLKSTLWVIIAFIIAFYSSWYRLGIGIIYLMFSVLYLAIPQEVRKKKICINPLILTIVLIAIACIYIIAINNFQSTRTSLLRKAVGYFEYTEESIAQSGFLKWFSVKNIEDVPKTPFSLPIIVFTPINWFTTRSFNFLFLALFRFFSFSLVASMFFSMLTSKSYFSIGDTVQIFLPTLVLITALAISNIGISRHFISFIPFIILIGKNYPKAFTIRRVIVIGLIIYSLYFIAYLISL